MVLTLGSMIWLLRLPALCTVLSDMASAHITSFPRFLVTTDRALGHTIRVFPWSQPQQVLSSPFPWILYKWVNTRCQLPARAAISKQGYRCRWASLGSCGRPCAWSTHATSISVLWPVCRQAGNRSAFCSRVHGAQLDPHFARRLILRCIASASCSFLREAYSQEALTDHHRNPTPWVSSVWVS